MFVVTAFPASLAVGPFSVTYPCFDFQTGSVLMYCIAANCVGTNLNFL